MSVRFMEDDFENGRVDPRKWKAHQIEPHQIAFSNTAATGNKSIVITTTARDGGTSCGEFPCQRAELRLHGSLRPNYGTEVFYGFSFKVTGDIQPFGSNRTVIGQWKAPGDDSPFLAQRFDNGVFHITVQDAANRMTVASAKGDPDALDEFQHLVADLNADPNMGPAIIKSAKARADLKAYRQASVEQGQPDTEAASNLVAAAETFDNLQHDRLEQLFDQFDYIQDLECYASRPGCTVQRLGSRMLPDPKEDWVNMIYRIKGGREDNRYGPIGPGEIDIWANGELIVEVRGNMGYPTLAPPDHETMYFKFGMYRNPLPNTILFHFDNFKQAGTLDEILS